MLGTEGGKHSLQNDSDTIPCIDFDGSSASENGHVIVPVKLHAEHHTFHLSMDSIGKSLDASHHILNRGDSSGSFNSASGGQPFHVRNRKRSSHRKSRSIFTESTLSSREEVSPLFQAVDQGNEVLLQSLIEEGIDNLSSGRTSVRTHPIDDSILRKTTESPLYRACSKGVDKLVEILLRAGANPNDGVAEYRVVGSGYSELYRSCLVGAVEAGFPLVVSALLDGGVDPDSEFKTYTLVPGEFGSEEREEYTSLHAAISVSDVDSLSLLLEKKASVAKEKFSYSKIKISDTEQTESERHIPPVCLAVNHSSTDCLLELFRCGADPNSAERVVVNGEHSYSPALHLAISSGNTSLVEYLLFRGKADIYLCDSNGFSPLERCAQDPNLGEMTHLLFRAGCSVSRPSSVEDGNEHPLSLNNLTAVAAQGGNNVFAEWMKDRVLLETEFQDLIGNIAHGIQQVFLYMEEALSIVDQRTLNLQEKIANAATKHHRPKRVSRHALPVQQKVPPIVPLLVITPPEDASSKISPMKSLSKSTNEMQANQPTLSTSLLTPNSLPLVSLRSTNLKRHSHENQEPPLQTVSEVSTLAPHPLSPEMISSSSDPPVQDSSPSSQKKSCCVIL